MPFLLAMDLPSGSEVPFQTNPQLPLDPIQLAVPLQVEGSVESFDPVARAADLAVQLPKQWCGTYKPFDGNPTVSVTLQLTQLKAVGQMVDMRGVMKFGSVSKPVQGNLHAKSDQLDLIPLGDNNVNGLESGNAFLGLQGFSPSGIQPIRLVNSSDPTSGVGGRLALSSCFEGEGNVPVLGLW